MNKTYLFLIIFISSFVIGSPFVINKMVNNENVQFNQMKNEINEEEQKLVSDNIKKEEEDQQKEQTEEQPKQDTKPQYKFVKVDDSYFQDALFIGDSRTVGIAEYADLKKATFFADTGMSIYNVQSRKVSVPSVGKVKIEDLLSSKKYGKIYIMLGINELGYNTNQTVKEYKKFIEYIQKKQSNAIIYIEANLHVTEQKSKSDKTFNNTNINKFNNEIKKLSNNKTIFYIDINEAFDDENGNLRSDYTHDNIHIYAKYYKEWGKWISEHAIDKGG